MSIVPRKAQPIKPLNLALSSVHVVEILMIDREGKYLDNWFQVKDLDHMICQ